MSGTITPTSLRIQRAAPNVIILKFLRAISRKDSDEYLWVFEGEDIKYYGSRIETFTGRFPTSVFVANGRNNVLECLNKLDSDDALSAERVAFFVDADVVRPAANQKLYVTPGYSIENLYVTDRAFERMLIQLFNLGDVSRARERRSVAAMYSRACTRFSGKLSDLMAWIYVQQIVFAQSSSKLNLKNVSLNKLIPVSLIGKRIRIRTNYGILKIRNIFPHAAKAKTNDVAAMKQNLYGIDWHQMGRGKYWAEFFCALFRHLHADSNRASPNIFKIKYRVSVNAGLGNFLETFSSFADTPDCLRAFLLARQ